MGDVRTLRRSIATARARRLRRQDTDAEARLWSALRAHRLGGWKWKRQLPFGPFILDFACVEARLVVEVDGGQHAERTVYDARRTAFIEAAGWRVVRFWNSDVLTNRDGVCVTILDLCGGGRVAD
jgi:primosomal protein N' (replication factor Y)